MSLTEILEKRHFVVNVNKVYAIEVMGIYPDGYLIVKTSVFDGSFYATIQSMSLDYLKNTYLN